MTYLLLQTFLLLLSAYFLGAFSGCLARRVVASRPAKLQPAVVDPIAVQRAEVMPLEAPRSIDPVQPKINILPRPKPAVLPTQLDISRFERALTGPDPNEGMPREMIVEIRPAVLESPTGPPLPWPPPAPPEPVVDEVLPVEEDVVTETAAVDEELPAAEPASDVYIDDDDTSYDEGPSSGMGASGGMAMATAAAAAAMSATRDAEGRPVEDDEDTEASYSDYEPAEAATGGYKDVSAEDATEPAAMPSTDMPPTVVPSEAMPSTAGETALIEEGDDLQSIRAIDADTEQELKAVGVMTFEQMALWTPDDIELYGEELKLGTRIDDEQWIEQAQILAKGGDTYYSRNRAAALREAAGGDDEASSVANESGAEEPASEAVPEDAERGVETAADEATQDEAMQEPSADAGQEETDAAAGLEGAAGAAAFAASAPETYVSHNADADTEEPDNGEPDAPAAQYASGYEETVPDLIEEPVAPPPSPIGQRSVAEMAAAAAAAIAAASASVTRGIRPIEPISPLSRVNPNIVLPARLSDAIKERDAKAHAEEAVNAPAAAAPMAKPAAGKGGDDLKRIRGVGVLIERQLNANGVTSYEQIANWSSGDIEAISAKLDFKGRIERENWVEQARILSSGGETEFSKRVDRGDVETSSGGGGDQNR